MRRRSLLIGLAAAVCSALLVYGIYMLQLRQLELQHTVQVVVPKEFIAAGTRLEAGLVELKSIQRGAYQEGMITELSAVVGQEALVPLGGKEPILDWKLNRFRLLPGRSQATFQIPKEYILSVSSGIRAGDQVMLYASAAGGQPHRLFERTITVASVKSSANVEVDNPKTSNLLSKASGDAEKMYVSRLEANGAIDQINLNLTEEQWLELDRLCSARTAKLVIAFSSASITELEYERRR